MEKHAPENMLKLQKRASKYNEAEEAMKNQQAQSEGDGNNKKRNEEHEYEAKDIGLLSMQDLTLQGAKSLLILRKIRIFDRRSR